MCAPNNLMSRSLVPPPTGIVKIVPTRFRRYANTLLTIPLIVLQFAVGFSVLRPALLFYVIVGGLGLPVAVATRFNPPEPAARVGMVHGPA
jgi:hypothetical protein